MAGHYHWQGESLLLSVRVQPRASRDEIVGPHGDNAIKVRITAPPVDGKANAHLVRFIARSFGVPPSHVELLTGDNGRRKQLCIHSPNKLPATTQITQIAGHETK